MVPAGYMAKRVYKQTEWLTQHHVTDIYSVSGCISEDFADYINYWKHNGYWFFNSPEIIKNIAAENSIQLEGTTLFYYEAYENELEDEGWRPWAPEPSMQTDVVLPPRKRLEGFDVVTFHAKSTPECSPLSCNGIAKELLTNAHCLFASFDEARANLDNGSFKNSEPGPYRIFAVYSVDWAPS
jgi:hypothetical protein